MQEEMVRAGARNEAAHKVKAEEFPLHTLHVLQPPSAKHP